MNLQDIKKLEYFKNEKILSLDKLSYQGYCNINYKIKSDKKSYLLRVFKNDDSVNISREFEYKVQKKASKKKLAPKCLYFQKDYILMEFLEGKNKNKISEVEIRELCKCIKKVHNFKIKTNEYDFKKDFKSYEKQLKDKESKKLIKDSRKELKNMKKYKKDLGLCHHDLNPKNIIFQKNKIKIIDWEYAGTNDIFFDLASLYVEFKLKKSDKELLINNYFKSSKKRYIKKLNSYIKIYENICLLWFKTLEKR